MKNTITYCKECNFINLCADRKSKGLIGCLEGEPTRFRIPEKIPVRYTRLHDSGDINAGIIVNDNYSIERRIRPGDQYWDAIRRLYELEEGVAK